METSMQPAKKAILIAGITISGNSTEFSTPMGAMICCGSELYVGQHPGERYARGDQGEHHYGDGSGRQGDFKNVTCLDLAQDQQLQDKRNEHADDRGLGGAEDVDCRCRRPLLSGIKHLMLSIGLPPVPQTRQATCGSA